MRVGRQRDRELGESVRDRGCDRCERERERGLELGGRRVVKVGRGRIGQEKGKSWEK